MVLTEESQHDFITAWSSSVHAASSFAGTSLFSDQICNLVSEWILACLESELVHAKTS